jgi:hypothetical protein
VVETAVDRHPDGVLVGLGSQVFDQVGIEWRCPGDDHDVFVHFSSAGIIRIRFVGR